MDLAATPLDADTRAALHARPRRIVGAGGPEAGNAPEAAMPTGGDLRADRHLHREILFIVRGESRFWLDGRLYPARPGTAFLLDRWEPHSFGYGEEERRLTHLWVHLSADAIWANLLSIGANGQDRMSGPHLRYGDDLFRFTLRRWEALRALGPCPRGRALEFMAAPLSALLSEYALALDGSPPVERAGPRDVVVFLEQYIASVNGRDCSLARLEALCGYSRFHLSRLFRARTGLTLGEYLARVRLRFAREAERRGLRQKEIARELGFSSPSAYWLWRRNRRTRESMEQA